MATIEHLNMASFRKDGLVSNRKKKRAWSLVIILGPLVPARIIYYPDLALHNM